MSMYSKFNNKNLNTNFDFINGLVVGNHNNNDIKWRQTGSGDHEKLNVFTNETIPTFSNSAPLKDEIYDELFKQATVKTNSKSSSNTLIIKTKKNHKIKKDKSNKTRNKKQEIRNKK